MSLKQSFASHRLSVLGVSFNQIPEAWPSFRSFATERCYDQTALKKRFDPSQPLRVDVLSFNGKKTIINDVWKTLSVKDFVSIPSSTNRLFKRSVCTNHIKNNVDHDVCEWAQLLKKRNADGNLHRATSIDLRVGSWWDGAIVEYADGHKSHWGSMHTNGHEHHFGGTSQKIELPPSVDIKHIKVNRGCDDRNMQGVQMHLSDKTVRGELNARGDTETNTIRLEPAAEEVIVGFYGKSGQPCGIREFGIITAPKDVGLDGLPDVVFDLPELRNTVGMSDD